MSKYVKAMHHKQLYKLTHKVYVQLSHCFWSPPVSLAAKCSTSLLLTLSFWFFSDVQKVFVLLVDENNLK